LQELPEQWNNTKKIALNVKQLVAPLQAAEVMNIRRKITVFDNRQFHYRDRFKKLRFFKCVFVICLVFSAFMHYRILNFERFECADPYELIQEAHEDVSKYESDMTKIQESASLFEVNMPEFKPLKSCRRELKMLKVCVVAPAKLLHVRNSTFRYYSTATMGLHIFSTKLY